jgi:hypothetical protein
LDSDESVDLDQDSFSYQLKLLARNMNEANYPITFGDMNELNTMGTELLRMMSAADRVRVLLASHSAIVSITNVNINGEIYAQIVNLIF